MSVAVSGLHAVPPATARPSISLLDADDGFHSAVPAADRPMAHRALRLVRHELPAGGWDPQAPLGVEWPMGILILEGAVVQEVEIGDRSSAHLQGPGDILRPWRSRSSELPCSTRWSVLGGSTIAVLDERLMAAARRWPLIVDVLHSRLDEQLEAASRHLALCNLPRVEDRVLALFWDLARRWGVVRGEQIVIRLPLTHDLIGRMTGARRPTVSLALTDLAGSGHLHREPGDAWVLARDSRSLLTPPGELRVQMLRAL